METNWMTIKRLERAVVMQIVKYNHAICQLTCIRLPCQTTDVLDLKLKRRQQLGGAQNHYQTWWGDFQVVLRQFVPIIVIARALKDRRPSKTTKFCWTYRRNTYNKSKFGSVAAFSDPPKNCLSTQIHTWLQGRQTRFRSRTASDSTIFNLKALCSSIHLFSYNTPILLSKGLVKSRWLWLWRAGKTICPLCWERVKWWPSSFAKTC